MNKNTITTDKKLVLIAQIVSTKGLKGEVKLKSFSDDPLFLLNYILLDELNVEYLITSAYLHKNLVIAKIKGCNTIDSAELMVGKQLFIYRESMPLIDEEDTYYHDDLIGLNVINKENVNLGTIIAVYNFGAGDILEINNNSSEQFMIAFTKDQVSEVNLKENYIVIVHNN